MSTTIFSHPTIFKLHCGKLTLKIYTKGERVLRIEAVAHNTREFNCGRSLEKFLEVVSRLKAMLERFADALSCIDQCFIADEMLEHLPPSMPVEASSGNVSKSNPRESHSPCKLPGATGAQSLLRPG